MKEFIGENMGVVFEKLNIPYMQGYSGNIGHWPNFGVYKVLEQDFSKLCDMPDDEFEKEFPESWWRYAESSNMGTPNCEFVINGHQIDAWQNEWYVDDLVEEYYILPLDEQLEYNSVEEYVDENYRYKYSNLLEYMCDELGVSTEKNVCALATDLAKYNEMSIALLFKLYGGSK